MKADDDLYLSFFISPVKRCKKPLLVEMMKHVKAGDYKNILSLDRFFV